MDINATVNGERAIALQLEKFPDRLHERLLGAITRITGRLLTTVQAAEPQRTGQLKSETKAFIDETPDLVRGRVKISAPGVKGEYGKAAAEEYGAHKATVVTEHHATLAHLWGRAIAPMDVIVDRYTRSPNIAPVNYLRGPFGALRNDAHAEMLKALEETAAQP